ncbi:hypothetical protein BS17DRAFT_784837 [Gyrodon lividus]|nr:hypothetical protein BS17DRAFT_784837 [Gyrodon lividus]
MSPLVLYSVSPEFWVLFLQNFPCVFLACSYPVSGSFTSLEFTVCITLRCQGRQMFS